MKFPCIIIEKRRFSRSEETYVVDDADELIELAQQHSARHDDPPYWITYDNIKETPWMGTEDPDCPDDFMRLVSEHGEAAFPMIEVWDGETSWYRADDPKAPTELECSIEYWFSRDELEYCTPIESADELKARVFDPCHPEVGVTVPAYTWHEDLLVYAEQLGWVTLKWGYFVNRSSGFEFIESDEDCELEEEFDSEKSYHEFGLKVI